MSLREMLTQTSEEEHSGKQQPPWGDIILASTGIQLATFSGLFFFTAAGCIMRRSHTTGHWDYIHKCIVPSFAAGALLATTVFLIVPESYTLLIQGMARHGGNEAEEVHEGEIAATVAWRFGADLLAGFLFPILLGVIFPVPEPEQCEECIKRESAEALETPATVSDACVPGIKESERTVESLNDHETGGCGHSHGAEDAVQCRDVGDEESGGEQIIPPGPKEREQEQQQQKQNWPLALSILLGDFFHNFTDGIFLGNAFMLCGRGVAYAMVATTIYHELAQETADYALLTHHCGLTRRKALTLNFLSGFSVLIGAIVIVSLELPTESTGALLAVSAGVYLYISAVECIPRVQSARKSPRDTMTFLLCFILGAVPVGLVLLNHGHCDGD